MTRKVEVQAISWPTSWLPERQITPRLHLLGEGRLAPRRGAGVVGRARPACCGVRVHAGRAA